MALIENNRVYGSDPEYSLGLVVRSCLQALTVSRVSIWTISSCKTQLVRIDGTHSDDTVFMNGTAIATDVCDNFLQALDVGRVVKVENITADERTQGLVGAYIQPNHTCAMLAAPVRHNGVLSGVLCADIVGESRVWTQREQSYLASLAEVVSRLLLVNELNANTERYCALFENTSEGIIVFSGGKFVEVNPAICRIFGGSESELLGISPVDVSPEFQPDGQPSKQKALAYVSNCMKGTPQNFEWTHMRLDGTQFDADVTLNPVHLAGEDTLFALVRDITSKKNAERQARSAKAELEFRACHDSLTGLLNREQFHRHVNALINDEAMNNEPSQIALYLFDLNHFKEVNDTLGHATGDKVLVNLACVLKEKIDIVGGQLFRLGGDEFVAVFDAKSCSVDFSELESILNRSMNTSIDLDDMSIEMGASIGIALYPGNGRDSHELLRCADVAMYHAKNHDGESSWYDARNDLNNKRRLAIMVEFGNAIRHQELVLHYQPRIDLETGRAVGCEALVRWHHPTHGLVPPGDFMPMVELSNLIHPLSEWVLCTAVAQIEELCRQGFYLPVAINVSARNLADFKFVNVLEKLIEERSLDPSLLEIELTESALINHPQRAIQNLNRLDQLGVSVAIDDFGQGYSSLSHLKQLPVDTLKIDRSFVIDMLSSESDAIIVDSIISLAHNFSLSVVAEGVENQKTLNALAVRHCDQAQGFHIARPMASEDFEAWLRKRRHCVGSNQDAA